MGPVGGDEEESEFAGGDRGAEGGAWGGAGGGKEGRRGGAALATSEVFASAATGAARMERFDWEGSSSSKRSSMAEERSSASVAGCEVGRGSTAIAGRERQSSTTEASTVDIEDQRDVQVGAGSSVELALGATCSCDAAAGEGAASGAVATVP